MISEYIIFPSDFEKKYNFVLSERQRSNLEIAKRARQKIKIRVGYLLQHKYLVDLVVFQ